MRRGTRANQCYRHRGVRLLRGCDIAGLKRLSNRAKRLHDQAIAAKLTGCVLRECDEVGLGSCHITGLQVLSQLPEFTPNLLRSALDIRNLRKDAAADGRNAHNRSLLAIAPPDAMQNSGGASGQEGTIAAAKKCKLPAGAD